MLKFLLVRYGATGVWVQWTALPVNGEKCEPGAKDGYFGCFPVGLVRGLGLTTKPFKSAAQSCLGAEYLVAQSIRRKREDTTMIAQLAFGSCITLMSLLVGGSIWAGLNEVLQRMEPWLRRPHYHWKSAVVVLMVVLSSMAIMTFGVWLWAVVFERMVVFATLEEALYYSLVAY
ncbi:MAG: hypothetical protein AAGA63_14340, partial [Pseudomonadota bacterium]